ncbi:hypothetical protein HanXRQr2_Chr02g0080121 [Helianthus annuus]|uniref:Uncharacterized protein n=1 Tax=Helianthus annuus TaxID=4232 RepID=A0A9K3JR29_HELAN|nr:hypothetical protein HanXRQr2_Chr02g0080121 [Helianthus annuus]KAJ0619805.1 hypothetical protein HanHA89_Chr02g0075371 [Helianthus annuus]KAJ0778264.1 hypothetical protein HanLR1_Chr02g0069771 [Helianthus annuus]KAJ0952903.1 hypothetical protein HanPSC8_Chr02g0077731 [Helianthus annuus]
MDSLFQLILDTLFTIATGLLFSRVLFLIDVVVLRLVCIIDCNFEGMRTLLISRTLRDLFIYFY